MKGDICENANQAYRYIVDELNCQVSYNTVKKAIDDGKIAKRRGRGFTREAVKSYARTLEKKISADSPKDDLPVTEGNEAPVAKTRAEAELKQVQAERARFLLDKERGKYILTSVMEAELGRRAKAFKLGLEKFAPDHATTIAEMFGGSESAARELCTRLGVDPQEGIPQVIDFAHSRIEPFNRLWRKQVLLFLDSYATGTWWTEEMQLAWDKLMESEVDDAA